MAYEMVMPYHLHMPSYFLETFTEYPFISEELQRKGYSIFPMLKFSGYLPLKFL